MALKLWPKPNIYQTGLIEFTPAHSDLFGDDVVNGAGLESLLARFEEMVLEEIDDCLKKIILIL